MLRRFGIVGDIHAEDAALAGVLEFLAHQRVESILVVGDIIDGSGDVGECCQLLAKAGALAVRGNHERWFLAGQMRTLPGASQYEDVDDATRHYLGALPVTRRFPTPRGSLLLCHGTGDDDMAAVRPEDDAEALATNEALQSLLDEAETCIMVCGHTHRRMVRQVGPLAIVNAGTLRRGEDPGFGIVDLIGEPEVTFFERIASGRVVMVDVVRLPTR